MKVKINRLKLDEIYHLSRSYGAEQLEKKYKFLSLILKETSIDFKIWPELHDYLLFMLAYPDNEKLEKTVLKTLVEITKKYRKHNKTLPNADNTGIAYTPVRASFGLELTTWLSEEQFGKCKLFSIDATDEECNAVFALLLPYIEKEKFENTFPGASDFLKLYKGKLTSLQFLISLFKQLQVEEKIKDFLFQRLQVYIEWEPVEFSRTMILGGLTKAVYYPNGFVKKEINSEFYSNSYYKKIKLNLIQKEDFVKKGRAILACLLRETDPVTYADTGLTEACDMGDGYVVVFYYLRSDQILSPESYIGYIQYKNGLPIAYGGAWLFGKQAKIGLNIFSAYRGGESARIFANLIKAYHCEYGVERFIAEPYQLGHNNEEGLKSGAFWFYYKLGFKPTDRERKKLSELEWNKIKKDKKYRTSLTKLKNLVCGQVVLNLKEGDVKTLIDPQEFGWKLQQKITDLGLTEWRNQALKLLNQLNFDYTRFNSYEDTLYKVSLLFSLLPKPILDNNTEIIKELIWAKSEGNERLYQSLLLRAGDVVTALEQVLKK